MNNKIFKILNKKMKYLYCFIDEKLKVIFLSESPVKEFLDIAGYPDKGEDATTVFPELFGLEDEMERLLHGEGDELKIPKVNRTVNDAVFVFNLCLFPAEEDNRILLFIEDITEEAKAFRLLQQNRNENEILRKEIQKKNSDLKEAYGKLEKQNTELRKLMQMKDDFLAIASHDLRSPFNAILGFSNLLLEEPDMHPSHKELVEIIKNSASAQLEYVNDILNVLKLETGQIKLRISSFSLKSVLDNCIKMFGVLAANKKISLQTNINEDIKLNIDYEKISQVLNNLVGNAIKFTPSGGNIEVSAFKNNKEQIELHVKDNGLGIEKDDIKGLFTRYTQTHKSGTDGEKGTGLGLAICKNLINLHGGEIYVESYPGKGSDFYFYLPL